MKRFLVSLVIFSATLTATIGLTTAFFSDTETSSGNTLTAGKLDLKIDNTSYYNGQANEGTTWESSDLPGHLFFDFNDIKPSDWGEDTISLKVEDNNAWACMKITLTQNDDRSCTEPEKQDDLNCDEPTDLSDADLFDGDLDKYLKFIFWADDGDNVFENNETLYKKWPGNPNIFNGQNIILSDSTYSIWSPTPSPLVGGQTYYIGKAWCFGTTFAPSPLQQDGKGADSPITPANSTGGVFCNGNTINNDSQTDTFVLDVEFTAYQHRNNPTFKCDGTTPTITPTVTATPTPIACSQADVMLVLDRSGSINSTELAQLKTAAKDFVDALAPTVPGIHVGFSSFATSGTLNQHLSDNGTTVKTAIDTLLSGGFTNLESGINLAKVEQDFPGDGHDRDDTTSPDAMIIITDGHPNRPLPSSTADDLAKTAADNARAAGVDVYVVGVGADVNTAYLQTVADNAGQYYTVADYSGLTTILSSIDLCEQ